MTEVERRELTRRITSDFKFHPATETTGPFYTEVRQACELLAHRLHSLIPESRELSLALTKLEEAMFWANAGIARNQE